MSNPESPFSEVALRTYRKEEDVERDEREDSAFLGTAAIAPAREMPRFHYKQLLYGVSVLVIALTALTMAYSLGGGGRRLSESDLPKNASQSDVQEALREALASVRMPPDTPEGLPRADSILPEMSVKSLKRPKVRKFPGSHYDKLYDLPSEGPIKEHEPDPMPEDAFERHWTSPDWFKPDLDSTGSSLPPIQADNNAFKESHAEKELRLGRRYAVKRAFMHAWQGYKDYAWGHDELRPVSGGASDPFAGWGASIVDALGTLLIMGLEDEYDACREHINRLDFRLVEGKDWACGYRPTPSMLANESAPAYLRRNDRVSRATDVKLRVFETHIRYLGGLLGAYDLSGDRLMLERAEDLAEILARAYKTQTSIPLGSLDPGSDQEWYRATPMLSAEMGSNILEFTRLSQVTGNKSYFDIGQRTTDWLQRYVVDNTRYPPLLPVSFNSDMHESTPLGGTYTMGGMVDSYYEYLIKQHLLVGGATEQYSEMYTSAIETARKELFMPVTNYPGRDYLTIGDMTTDGNQQQQLQHLTCFAGGMLGLGGKLLNRTNDLDDGLRVTQTCYMMGAMTESGLQPEMINFHNPNNSASYEKIKIELPGKNAYGGSRWLVQEKLKGSPPGASASAAQYQGRPETIESVFYMYRLTGDKAWQERGWRMFTSWVKACKTTAGFSEAVDTRKEHPDLSDKMESFVLAEALKYYYLLFSEPELISLDDYVFNTEAHPFLLHNLKPGSHKFWTDKGGQDLGVRASGTDAQLWLRYDLRTSGAHTG